MIKAAKGLVLVLVDCTTVRGPERELMSKYDVTAFPGLVFAKPNGDKVSTQRQLDVFGVKAAMEKVKKEYSIVVKWEKSIDDAFEQARKTSKPAVVFFTDPNKKASPIVEGFFHDEHVHVLLAGFVCVKHAVDKECEVCQKHKISKGPAVYVFDPGDETLKPISKIKSFKTPAKLGSALKKAKKRYESKQA